MEIIVLHPGGVLQISSDGDDQRIFLGLKFSIPGFCWVGKFGRYFFGWLDFKCGFFGLFKTGMMNYKKIQTFNF